MRYRPTVECDACRYAWAVPEIGCRNPWCVEQVGGTPERLESIREAIQRAEATARERAERERLYARSFEQ